MSDALPTLVGEEYDVTLGPVAHGGHVVARHDGRVIFVRHGIPGERVRVRVTEERSRFLRADAVQVHVASPDRVPAPCRYAGPDGCGGCDFQHVSLPVQRELKARVVREQLERLAGLDVPVTVEPVTGDEGGLRWRTRVRYARTPSGRRGFRKHRSHEVVPVDDCLITRRDAREQRSTTDESPPVVELVETRFGAHSFTVDADGFWQVHPGAPRVLVETVLDLLAPRPDERCLDLFAGVGLFSAFLAAAVGPGGAVQAVEGDRSAVRHARRNLASYPWARAHRDRVDRWMRQRAGDSLDPDLVVLDPPREGAKRAVVGPLTALRPRAVAYVACDPAALARDTGLFLDAGYRLTRLRAFDLFPMTHHVECVALLERG